MKKTFTNPILIRNSGFGDDVVIDLPSTGQAGDPDFPTNTPQSFARKSSLYGTSYSSADYIEWWSSMYELDPVNFSLDRFNELNAELRGDWMPSDR